MISSIKFSIIFFLSLLVYCFAQNCDKQTCSECVQELNCIWCISPNNDNHCMNNNSLPINWCKSENIINPQKQIEILQDRPFASEKNNVVQVKPQKLKISLRKDEEISFTFKYKQSENYPVDLYYLMDLSSSMEKHRKQLSQLGLKLALTMKNITNNFRMGFGSFVDKVELPFVSTFPAKLKSPCNFQNKPCAAPYSFKNHMSLSTEYSKFVDEVGASIVSGNLDAPEGGLDAIMQSIVCKEQIGWRPQARHLLVFSTDAYSHVAGDGKLAGVVIPNDGKCHMENNEYTDGLIYDYPSISHINKVAKENNINIIFAIVDIANIVSFYTKFSQHLENSNIGALDKNSDNVIKLVTDNYNRIVDSVTMTSTTPSNIRVSITSDCPPLNRSTCSDIRLGQEVTFTATLKLLQCDPTTTTHQITIKPSGLEEEMSISVTQLCDCPSCEKPSSIVQSSPSCSNNGDLICGVCLCHPNYRGAKCECSSTSTSSSNSTDNCEKNGVICSNLGTCKCGQCECKKRPNPNERIFGKYCECDNYSCNNYKGQLCAGKGTCQCGVCECFSGWTGSACQCPDTNSSCIQPGSNLVCNGHGDCNCGRCECYQEEVRHAGQYCEKCLSCPEERCEEFRHCVECQAYKSGKWDEEKCALECTMFETRIVKEIGYDEGEDVILCTIADSECTWNFVYQLVNEEFVVRAPEEKACTQPNIIVWVAGVIGSILLAGLLMALIWKIFTTVHDRREYAKFENERKNLKWHTNKNPLFQEATTTFQNPAYNKRLSFRS